MTDGKLSPPLFGEDSDDEEKENDEMFASANENTDNNNQVKQPAKIDSSASDDDKSKKHLDTSDKINEMKTPHDEIKLNDETKPHDEKKSQDEAKSLNAIIPAPTTVSSDDSDSDMFGDPKAASKAPAPAARPKVYPSSTDSFSTKTEGEGLGAKSHSGKIKESEMEELEVDPTTIEILVSDPKKVGDGINSYVVYRITTRTNSKLFQSCEFTVTRRFSDFLGLHDKLLATYQPLGKIVPPPPEKSVMGTTKVKMAKEETGSQDFVEKRRAALERFVNRVARHPELRCDTSFIEFLEMTGDLPKATSTSALSGAGLVRLFSKVGESINRMTFTIAEPDQWFEDKQEEIETYDQQLKELHGSLELLVLNRKELAVSTGQFAKSVANLGSVEEHMTLSRSLSSLADIEVKVEQLHSDQCDSDFFIFSELVKDYLSIIQSIKDVLHERMKQYKIWQDCDGALAKKKEQKVKLEQQRKVDKNIDNDIADCEERVQKFKENFESISASVRKELLRFDKQREKDFKTTLLNYLQCMMNKQQQLATCWESFLPEARNI